jgi:hypothetical protein
VRIAVALLLLALAACSQPSGEARPETVARVLAVADGQVGRPVDLVEAGLIMATNPPEALGELRGQGFVDTDPRPCSSLLPDAERPAALDYTDTETPAEKGAPRTVRRILACVAPGQDGTEVRVLAILAATQTQTQTQTQTPGKDKPAR